MAETLVKLQNVTISDPVKLGNFQVKEKKRYMDGHSKVVLYANTSL